MPASQQATDWTQNGRLLPANASAYDYTGEGIAIDGDTLVLGARGHNEAFVYLWNGSQWAEQAYLTPADGAANDRFGYAVAIDGDTIAVGAYLDDDLGADSGSVYVFTRSGAAWTQQAKLTAADGAAGDWFGYAVSLSGDSLIVGARNEDDGGSNAGAAYVFTRSGGVWTQQAKLTAGDAGGNDWFGYAAALSGDTAAVGAPREDGAANNAGSVYVFTRSGNTWTQQAKLTAGDAGSGDQFGSAVSLDNGTLLAGARYEDEKGGNAGAAYVFSGSGVSWSQQAKLTAADGAAGDMLGYSVSVDGNTALVGAISQDAGAADTGAAYVFAYENGSWGQQAKLTADTGASGDQFGFFVGLSGSYAVIGAPQDDDAGSNAGSAYTFVAGDQAVTSGERGE
ncbi:MAG TPA: hypothetical protein ENK32_06935 [Anaerolineae bacterium]|nr:hypothetical protein [Anaerolineae bacterium]